MWKHKLLTVRVVSTIGPALWCTVAFAQQTGGGGDAPAGGTVSTEGGSGSSTTVVVNPPSTTTTTTESVTSPFGVPSSNFDPDQGLSSSSRAAGEDGFDMKGPGNTATIRGSESGGFVLGKKGVTTPNYHTVSRGDTLWDLCDKYYDNPWSWPRIWSYNPQIENPHWIYPGDRLRMRGGAGRGGMESDSGSGDGFVRRQGFVPSGTVFLRDRGYVGDERRDVWGKLVGSPDDQMLLSENDEVYLEVKKGKDVRIGQEFTVFRPLRKPEKGKGYIVTIQGTARVNAWNPKTRIARAQLTESLDVIERGAKIGPLGRRFDVVPPVRNDREIWAKITAALEPRAIIGQHQVVFINKGHADGLRAGNRLFAIRRGDRWGQSLRTAGPLTSHQMRYRLYSAEVEKAPNTSKGKKLPREVIGEIRILRTKAHSSACVVTYSEFEMAPGAVLVARRGY